MGEVGGAADCRARYWLRLVEGRARGAWLGVQASTPRHFVTVRRRGKVSCRVGVCEGLYEKNVGVLHKY